MFFSDYGKIIIAWHLTKVSNANVGLLPEVQSSLLHKKFHLVNWSIGYRCCFMRAYAQLYVVTGWGWQGFGEIGRVVELTAATDAVLAIPQWVSRIEYEPICPWCMETTFTEVIISHKRRRLGGSSWHL